MGLLDDIAGVFGLGGGGGSAGSYEVKSTIGGGLTSTIQGGDRAVVVDVGLDDVNVELASQLTSTVQGGELPIALDVGGGVRPINAVGELTATTSSNLAVTEPIVSEISSRLDVEPVVVDLCVDVGLSKLPQASIRQPYKSHFGVQVLGTELFGFDWVGHSDTVIDELPDRGPKVVGESHDAHTAQDAHTTRHAPRPIRPRDEAIAEGRGRSLRIRLD